MSDIQFVDKKGRRLSTADNSDHPVLRFFDEDRRKAVTKEYAGAWFVQTGNGVDPHVQVEENGEKTYVRLEREESENRYRLPKQKRDPGKAGVLQFYDKVKTEEYVKLSPSLYVQPGSLTEDEYNRLLRRIGELAVATESAKMTSIPETAVGGISDEEANIPNEPWYEPHFRASRLYLRLAEVAQGQWPLIAQSPSQEIGYRTRQIDVRRSRISPQVAKRRAQRPHKRRIFVRAPAQVTETVSNQAVAFILRRILIQQAPTIIDQLDNVTSNIVQWDAPLYDVIREEREKTERDQERIEGAAEGLTRRIERVKSWAEGCAQQSFIAEHGLRPELPRHPTRRLMRSAAYGPLYRALIDYLDHQVASLDPQEEGLMDVVRNRGVLRTADLYEKWVFMEIYGQLILSFGFETTEEGEDPFSNANVASGVLQLPRGSSYRLSRSLLKRGQEWSIEAELSYDRKIDNPPNYTSSHLRPDVCLDIHFNHSDRRIVRAASSTQRFRFAFDAKYRRYRAMKDSGYRKEDVRKYNGSHYFLDLLGTARGKYFGGLDSDAAFVIHSDPNWDSYWGEKPVEDLTGGDTQPEAEGFVNHQFGSIFSTPDGEGKGIQRIERLLRCVLMYHCKVDEYCWTCGNKVAPERVTSKGHSSGKGKGCLYQCCSRFWIVTHCTGNEEGDKHRLVKFEDPFHAIDEDKDTKWSCICPKCGDLFGDIPEWKARRIDCPRCNGRGEIPRYRHVRDGECFRCEGNGYLEEERPVGTSEVNIEERLQA